MVNKKFFEALDDLVREKGIDKAVVLEAFEQGIISAYKRSNNREQADVRVEIDEEKYQIYVYERRKVVEEVENPQIEITIDEARTIKKTAMVDDVVEVQVTPKDFGRIAIQSAKQRITQAVIEAERNLVYEEFADRELDLITGLMNRRDERNIYINLGRTDGILPLRELLPTEEFEPNKRIKVLINKVEKTTKGPRIILSRTNPILIKRLFELEVPEVYDGIVEIKQVARDAGSRSKVLVQSHHPDVDPIGACIGPNQQRINNIIDEINGEKIDLALYDPNPKILIRNALAPARVIAVNILDEDEKQTQVIVPDDQLSLAIGRRGQNARLAHQLTGWKIDIKSVQDAKNLDISYTPLSEELTQEIEE